MKRYSGFYNNTKSRILYASTTRALGYSPSRYGGTVAISYDEGASWKTKTIVSPETHFGYCSQVVLPDGTIGLFFETHNDNYKTVRYGAIKFIRYSLQWLDPQ